MRRSIAALCVTASLVAACDASDRATTPSSPSPAARVAVSAAPVASADPWFAYPIGWTRLRTPPQHRSGESWVWVGDELVVAGGCDPGVPDHCRETRSAFDFDPQSGRWRSIRPSPEPMTHALSAWTGTEAIFLEAYGTNEPIGGQAYDPSSGMWRPIAPAPLERGGVVVAAWTGADLIVLAGAGPSDQSVLEAAAYDPTTDSWWRLANAPLGLNLSSGMWTGRRLLVFGSLLDSRNHASTPTSVGAAYDPELDSWAMMPPSALSPQATSAGWLGDRMVAWDYETMSQEYDPETNRWSAPLNMPLAFSECYPDSVVVEGLLLAWFCGAAALYDSTTDAWRRIDGGPLEDTVHSKAYGRDLPVWRFADLVPAGPVVVMPMEGITLSRRGVACYGCEGSPRSYWVYRPPPHVEPDTSFVRPTNGDVRRAALGFLGTWLQGTLARLQWLATPDGLARFDARVPDLGAGANYWIDGRVEALDDGEFDVPVELVVRYRNPPDTPPEALRLVLVFGAGTSIGGDPGALLLVHVRR